MPNEQHDLMIEQKIHDMALYAYPVLAQYPKSEKFAMVTDIKHVIDEMFRLTSSAKKKYFKKTTLQDLDVCIDTMQKYIRLSFELKFISPKKYEAWSKEMKEIGKMLGGWLKTVNQKPAST